MYHNRTTNKKRMVLRNVNDAGQVMFNVAISNQMSFKKVAEPRNTGRVVWFVQFYAVENAGEDAKPVKLNVDPNDVDRFHEELEKLAAE